MHRSKDHWALDPLQATALKLSRPCNGRGNQQADLGCCSPRVTILHHLAHLSLCLGNVAPVSYRWKPIPVAPAWPRAAAAPTRGAHLNAAPSPSCSVCVFSVSRNGWGAALLLRWWRDAWPNRCKGESKPFVVLLRRVRVVAMSAGSMDFSRPSLVSATLINRFPPCAD